MSGRGSETVESYWSKLQKENGKSGGSFNRVWSSINKSGYPSTKLADQPGKKAEKEEEQAGNGATLPEKRPGTMKESSQNCQATIPSASSLPLVSTGDFLDEQELDRFVHPQLERLKNPSSQGRVQALQCLQVKIAVSAIPAFPKFQGLEEQGSEEQVPLRMLSKTGICFLSFLNLAAGTVAGCPVQERNPAEGDSRCLMRHHC